MKGREMKEKIEIKRRAVSIESCPREIEWYFECQKCGTQNNFYNCPEGEVKCYNCNCEFIANTDSTLISKSELEKEYVSKSKVAEILNEISSNMKRNIIEAEAKYAIDEKFDYLKFSLKLISLCIEKVDSFKKQLGA